MIISYIEQRFIVSSDGDETHIKLGYYVLNQCSGLEVQVCDQGLYIYRINVLVYCFIFYSVSMIQYTHGRCYSRV